MAKNVPGEVLKNDEHLKKQLVESGLLQALNSVDLANYPDALGHLAKFLEVVGLDPKAVISGYKSSEDVEAMKEAMDTVHDGMIATIDG